MVIENLLSKKEMIIMAVSTIGSVIAMKVIDKPVSDIFRERKGNIIINEIMRIGDIWGGRGALLTAGLLYVLLEDKTIGIATLKGTVISGVLARGITVITGRARPYSSVNNEVNFNIFKGLKYSLSSLPSGHSAIAFGFAAAAANNVTSPSMIKTIALYSLAGITAVSRVYDDKHWVSDVIMGGTLGYLIGNRV
jgi:membrane-associated phospholipid phosphatase